MITKHVSIALANAPFESKYGLFKVSCESEEELAKSVLRNAIAVVVKNLSDTNEDFNLEENMQKYCEMFNLN